MTNLPASDEAYDKGRSELTSSLKDAMTPDGAQSLSAFAGIVLIACFFGKNLLHLHRSEEDDNPDDLNGEFWKRHRNLDNISRPAPLDQRHRGRAFDRVRLLGTH